MNQKLHILFISSWYPSRVFAQNGDFIQRHAEAVATKHHVTVLHLVTDKTLKVAKEAVSFNKKNVQTNLIYIKPRKLLINRYLNFISTYIKQIKLLKKADVIHLNIAFPTGIIALYFKLFYKIPYIISEHSTFYQASKSMSFFKKILIKTIVKNASYVCPVSDNLKRAMIHLGLKGNYHPIPNVVDSTIFKPTLHEDKDFVITHISHMGNEHKNVKGIITSIAKLKEIIPNYKLKLIGSNAVKYKSLVAKLNLKNVCFINEVPHNEIAEQLNKSNVFVMFSNYENLPCVILEAFSCGIPVISTDVGGIREYFPKDFGYLIPKNNKKELQKAILKVYNAELNNNKTKMYNYVNNTFGIKKISNSFSQLYFKSLSN